MQCHLEDDELNLLADVLLEQIGTTSSSPYERGICNALLDKVLARDLRFDSDEFDEAARLLAAKRTLLRDQIASAPNAPIKAKLMRQLSVMERVLEKIDEACAMF
jgi:hypothetical protein